MQAERSEFILGHSTRFASIKYQTNCSIPSLKLFFHNLQDYARVFPTGVYNGINGRIGLKQM